MRISDERKALSQSTDLLLILTATLAVGGIMYGVSTGLISGMGNISSLQVAGASISVGTSSQSFAITMKNNGNTALKGTSTVSVVATLPSSGVTYTGGDTKGDSFTWSCTTAGVCATSASVTLSGGDTLSLAFNTPSGFTAGSTYTISGGLGSTTFSTSVVATEA
ncbi:MAG: hypothetical protein LYZ69_01395 [Nitrososphaerales archaeon]|nr:hypothetical protein [Nitrososphaerales archaeon]